MVYDEKAKYEDTHRWAVLGVISSIYFLVYFHRVSTSVIAPDLLDLRGQAGQAEDRVKGD